MIGRFWNRRGYGGHGLGRCSIFGTMIGGGGWNSEPCGVRYQRRVRSYRQKCQSEIAAKAIETVLPPRHKLQQLEIIGSIGAHPGKVHAPKDIETFKGLLAELGAGWRGGVMEGAWLDNPRRLHRID